MSQIVIRPTLKFVYMGYVAAALVMTVLIIALVYVNWPSSVPSAVRVGVPWLPVLLMIWPVKRHLRNRVTWTTILDSQLRYETGLLSRTTRTIMLPRVQDVTVHQRLTQRLFDVGDVSIETAGEAGRLTISQIDRPQKLADLINERSQKQNVVEPPV